VASSRLAINARAIQPAHFKHRRIVGGAPECAVLHRRLLIPGQYSPAIMDAPNVLCHSPLSLPVKQQAGFPQRGWSCLHPVPFWSRAIGKVSKQYSRSISFATEASKFLYFVVREAL